MKEDRNEVILLPVGFYSDKRMIFFLIFFRCTVDKTSRHSSNNYCLETAGERGGKDVINQKARWWEGK